MNYRLEKVTSEDWERFWRDLKADPKKFAIASNPRLRIYPVETWAIDKENDSYLIWGPSYCPGPESNDNFSFFYKERLYWIDFSRHGYHGLAARGGIVQFNKGFESNLSVFNNEELITSTKEALKQAFRVHRFFGDLRANHTFEVIFEDEMNNHG